MKLYLVLFLILLITVISKSKVGRRKSRRPLHKHRGAPMGVVNPECDDGKTKLEVDWDGWPDTYTCFDEHWEVRTANKPNESCLPADPNFIPYHHCMNERINYDDTPPTRADHRPLWPKYGEYLYVPPQRWLHNVEHGAVVMLYHPCADKEQVTRLKKIVRSCLRRHIITPYNQLGINYPLALITYGCKLMLNTVDENVAKTFIKEYALKGREATHQNGQFSDQLKTPASIVRGSDVKDSNLCPMTLRERNVKFSKLLSEVQDVLQTI